LTHRWGYAPTIDGLARDLAGGSVPGHVLKAAIAPSSRIGLKEDFVYLAGFESLLRESQDRVIANRSTKGEAREIADAFVADLLRTCPVIDCVAVSGSVASGGYVPGDDIDFDLFVRDGAKYLTYALFLLLGLRVALRHRRGTQIRKVVCVNVIWTRGQVRPFVRTDESLAFELLHCDPVYGAPYFIDTIEKNPWIGTFFPQITSRPISDRTTPEPNRVGRLVAWVANHRRILRLAEGFGRVASFIVYTTAHWLRRNDLSAMQRLEFLRRVKYPYEFFQD